MADWKQEWKPFASIVAVFLVLFFLPLGWTRFDHAVMESLHLAKWYAREHVLLCLIPAFLIAGAIAVFVSQASVMKYLGANAPKALAYGVASVSGAILAVGSCTVLPLFAGIYRMGAGLAPATAFLYSGPAINVLAIVLTARVLGVELGIARAVGAIVFSVVIGLAMHLIFRKEELEKAKAAAAMPQPEVDRPLWQNALYFASLVGVLVFANWGAGRAGRVLVRRLREQVAVDGRCCAAAGLCPGPVVRSALVETRGACGPGDSSGLPRTRRTARPLHVGGVRSGHCGQQRIRGNAIMD